MESAWRPHKYDQFLPPPLLGLHLRSRQLCFVYSGIQSDSIPQHHLLILIRQHLRRDVEVPVLLVQQLTAHPPPSVRPSGTRCNLPFLVRNPLYYHICSLCIVLDAIRACGVRNCIALSSQLLRPLAGYHCEGADDPPSRITATARDSARYTKLQAKVRAAFHRDTTNGKRTEFRLHLASISLVGSLSPLAPANPS
ncbi:hypothetical protein EXIGLDRAFT_314085 [Exidia glandulosa HHB12029]|uniref:Uncharacterized protein n=1 Tax=Exidia glandulosa HHB12029 TaxID=1314781 RepID=A0A165LUN9_EXIGL|nr:hypothetical protein EXIGLDRAFT_314085 [Exidia glandulosa HHB12029]